MIKLPDLKKTDLESRKVLLRLDLDVPLSPNSTIQDDTRLLDSLETLTYLLDNGATVFIIGHLGRPEHKLKIQNSESKIEDSKYSLEPVARWFKKHFNNTYQHSETFIDGFYGWKISEYLFLLENLRFYKGEEENDREFSKKLASLADIYVNDAFAVSHREHSSLVGVAKFLPHFAGFRLRKEVETLGNILQNPKRPLVVIIGGAKIETKLPVVEKMHHLADYVLVGGKIAEETKVLLKVQHEKVKGRKSVLLVADLNSQETDITPKDAENFLQIINLAKTVVWNGPLGKVEEQIGDKDAGSFKVASCIVKSGAYSIVGGGDTLGFLQKIGLLSKFSFVSTGGGAMLEFLSGEKLPGIEALIG